MQRRFGMSQTFQKNILKYIVILFLVMTACSCSAVKTKTLYQSGSSCDCGTVGENKEASEIENMPMNIENNMAHLSSAQPSALMPDAEIISGVSPDSSPSDYSASALMPDTEIISGVSPDSSPSDYSASALMPDTEIISGVSPDSSPSDYSASVLMPDTDISLSLSDLLFYSKYSDKLGINLDGTENKDLIMAIDEWFGTPFRMGGCSKYGVDCSCFVKKIYDDVYGLYLSRTSKSIYYEDLIPVKKEDLQEGDILCFKIRGRRISHIGIYLKDNKFVHASRKRGVMINDLNEKYYKKRYFSGGRVKGRIHMNISKRGGK